ncbi:MAG TPA: class I SAM-dependent methyltransferase, partial [Terriglobia bacterium]|nr:class I SAM-dependent methyltransferase [Terriglobia bacterium]
DYGAHLAGKHAASLYGRVVKAIEEFNPSAILDVGCGNGNLLALLNDGVRSLAGADLSPEMIKQARAKLGDRVDLKIADSEALPWESGAFDALSCTDSFHHYPNPQKVLEEMRRVLKPAGHLVIADPWAPQPFRWIVNFFFKFGKSGDVKLYSMEEWRPLIEASGFKVVRLERHKSSMLLVAQS